MGFVESTLTKTMMRDEEENNLDATRNLQHEGIEKGQAANSLDTDVNCACSSAEACSNIPADEKEYNTCMCLHIGAATVCTSRDGVLEHKTIRNVNWPC